MTVTPAQSDTQVTLKLTMTYSGRTDLTVSDTHTLTVKAAQAAPVDYNALLNAALTAQNALRDASTGETVSKDAVAGDVFVPNAPFIRDNLSNLGAEYQDFDNSKTPIRFFSSDPSVITINGTRATVYRPLPGDPAKKVTLTAQIRLRPEGGLRSVHPSGRAEHRTDRPAHGAVRDRRGCGVYEKGLHLRCLLGGHQRR